MLVTGTKNHVMPLNYSLDLRDAMLLSMEWPASCDTNSGTMLPALTPKGYVSPLNDPLDLRM